MKVEIVFLLAVIGQRLAGNLSSDDVAAMGEHGEKQRVHAGAFLKSVQDFSVPSSTNENCSHLVAYSGQRPFRQNPSGIRGDSTPIFNMEHSYFLW